MFNLLRDNIHMHMHGNEAHPRKPNVTEKLYYQTYQDHFRFWYIGDRVYIIIVSINSKSHDQTMQDA